MEIYVVEAVDFNDDSTFYAIFADERAARERFESSKKDKKLAKKSWEMTLFKYTADDDGKFRPSEYIDSYRF